MINKKNEVNKKESSAKKEAVNKARSIKHSTIQTIKERIKLLDILMKHLLKSDAPIKESSLAQKLYQENSATNRTKVKRHLTALRSGENIDLELPEISLQRVKINGSKEFGWIANPKELERYLKSLSNIKTKTDTDLSPDRALALALARKYLGHVMPPHLWRALENDFDAAEKLIQENIDRSKGENNINLLRQRVDMTQRGLNLQKTEYNEEILDAIYQAIISGKRVSFTYGTDDSNLKKHTKMSIAGVLIRTPKIYLYALPDNREYDFNNLRSFQVNLIRELSIHQKTASLIKKFDIKSYVQDGYADVPINFKDKEVYNVEIEVTNSGNLIRDLNAFPLYKKQSITKLKNGKYLLSFNSLLTHQLTEYIVARGSDFTVKKPEVLVNEIKNKLQRVLENYTD